MPARRIAILGAGLAGLTTAYWLHRAGAEVVVVDGAGGAGLGVSFANGGMLTPSQANPWNAPGILRYALANLGRVDSLFMVRRTALPGLLGWGARFVRESRPARHLTNARRNLALGLYALDRHREILAETGIACRGGATGTLQVFRDRATLESARAMVDALRPDGMVAEELDGAALLRLEPSLRDAAFEPLAGIHFRHDESGDAHLFCHYLAEHLRGQGVEFLHDMPVERLETSGGEVRALAGPRGRVEAGRFVVAAAAGSRALLRPLGLRLPIYPVRGYSLTLDAARVAGAPRIPTVDMHRKVAVTPLGPKLRVAGSAEFGGGGGGLDPARVAALLRQASDLLPALRGVPLAEMRPWTGLRPVTPTGFPCLGRGGAANLWVNTGHGPLGWTFAAGTGKILADLLLTGTHALAGEPLVRDAILA